MRGAGFMELKTGYVEIFKADAKQHIVWGVVLQPGVPDLQGDIISAEEIEKAAHDYMINSRVTGFRHKRVLDAAIVESYIAKSDEIFEGEHIKKGSWLVGMQVFDMEVWKGVETGDYHSFSIGGFAGNRIKVESGGGG